MAGVLFRKPRKSSRIWVAMAIANNMAAATISPYFMEFGFFINLTITISAS